MLTFLKYLRGIFNTTLKSDTVHHAVIQSIYDAFILVDNDIDLMRLEMCLSTASGSWLDYWGDFFTVYRKANESDSNYSRRIIEHVIRPKTTIPALKEYIVEYLNDEYQTSYTLDDVQIKEPWKDIGKLSHKGLLSRDALFYSGDYYRHSIIDISIPEKLTQDLMDLVLSVKAAGVKVIWSFLNSYGIVTGFNEANWAQADYARHIFMQTQRNAYGGLILSNTSPFPLLSGRREIWRELIQTYYWYAKMLDKDTDESILITKLDLVKMLDYYKIVETLLDVKDTGSRLDIMELSGTQPLSGAKTEEQVIERLVSVTEDLLKKIQFVDDWLTLSQQGELSQTSGTMFEFGLPHEIYCDLVDKFESFKQENPDYYNNLQPPLIIAEHIAKWYAKPHKNWLFDTLTMTQSDFYELWEMGNDFENNTLEDIYAFEQTGGAHYLTFGDVYQPPIVIAGSPWDWTPIMDSPWLWKSETLNNEELEEIYRTKFSGFPDMVEIVTEITTHPENAFNLSDNGVLSEPKYRVVTTYENAPESSLRLSQSGELNTHSLSGEKVQVHTEILLDESFDGYNYLSGRESTITKRRVVTEQVPTLGKMIEFEEAQDVGNTNEDINYSVRDWFQAPVQVGEYAQWLIPPHIRQLWNTKAMTNDDIRSFWNSEDGTGTPPDDFKEQILADVTIYQPPIVLTDTPFYWFNDHVEFDNAWLWRSETLTNEDLEQIYWFKFRDNPEAFPDIITKYWVTPTYPDKQLRLSDNAYMPYRKAEVTTTYDYHPENGLRLSENAIISNRKTEYRYDIQTINHPEHSFKLSESHISQTQQTYSTQLVSHPEDNFVLSQGTLDSNFQVSGGDIQIQYLWRDNPEYQGKRVLSGDVPEVQVSVKEINYDELPLKFLSGSLTTSNTTIKLYPDENGKHYLDGYPTQPYEEVVVQEKPVALGSLITLEEQQKLFQYSLRHILQSLIVIGEQAMWMVYPNITQLWDTPTLSKAEIASFWEGDNKPKSLRSLGKLLKADSIRYQPPIELTSEPYYFMISALQAYKLWDTYTITNEDIAAHWEGGLKTLEDIRELMLTTSIEYQAPIEISYTADPSMVKAHSRQLWNTPTITNEDILSWWDGTDKPSVEEFELEHLNSSIIYQPPIVCTDAPFYWIPTQDTPWLWYSENLQLEDLEAMYERAYPNTALTLGVIIDLEEQNTIQYSHRGICQSPILTQKPVLWKVDATYTKLWNTPAINNKDILSYWIGDNPPSRRNYEKKFLETEPYYTLPIIINYDTGDSISPYKEWLWTSSTLNNEDLEKIYAAKLNSENPILENIVNFESSYSLRGNLQSPIEIVPQS